ncbi:hypothetical protein N0824_02865 [Microcystis sp. 0824]|uniref:hypothetical protein n=1 Tax=Microcystis sp. 0824 TaxID=1502726 RepID=UPI000D0C70B2|nr:hypothetical protein [Microcystis sp. 0824]GBF54996.1 hypothetical protein N0824_02865 [Microcystis sp. 0824]
MTTFSTPNYAAAILAENVKTPYTHKGGFLIFAGEVILTKCVRSHHLPPVRPIFRGRPLLG